MASRIKKGDKVVVIAGSDKGRTGEVVKVLPDADRVVVQGISMIKRHTRQSAGTQGGIIERESSIHVSNVAHIDPKSKEPTRIGFKIEGDRKVRFAKRSGETLDK
jgi:large subunit ribosomal protein L24